MAIQNYFADFQYSYYFMFTARLLLACVLGGIIGYERESMQRPAGFRTHILVCVGAALIMITSEFIFMRYKGVASIDPTRLGAQVISGIGFLGAGTIIREGFNVKGLTTAASLWAVSCVGIAAGIGFYEGAVAATFLVYVTLLVLKRLEDNFSNRWEARTIIIHCTNTPGQIGIISGILDSFGIVIKNIEFANNFREDNMSIKLSVTVPKALKKATILDELQKTEGIQKVFEELKNSD